MPGSTPTSPNSDRTNTAAWLERPFGELVVRSAPYTSPGPDELVVRNRALAVNPLDEVKQSTGNLMYRWLPYPAVLGVDVAGEVVEIGSAVTRFRVGDRVVAFAVGMEKERNRAAEGGFQKYTVVRSILASPIPESLAFEAAVVLPLGLSTAASALFQSDQLGLEHPSASATPTNSTLVVWGGSTSVGTNAIQLAVAAGYDVVATASPHNHARLRELGARLVFDYRSPSVVADIVSALRGKKVAGVFAIGTGSAEPSVAIAAATGAKRVSLASPSVSLTELPKRSGPSLAMVRLGAKMVSSMLALQVQSRSRGIRTKFVWGSSLMNNEVGPMIWGDFLPSALAEGRYHAAPQAEVVGSGLGNVQTALDRLRAGVSAQKLVVILPGTD